MTENSDLRSATYDEVPVAKIHVPEGRRPVDEARVLSLAESIDELGLLHPVGLTVDYRLIYGARRLAAYQLLGRTNIPALIHNLDELHRQIVEIDENIQRSALTVLETCKALARRKEIYETLHPGTQSVTKRGGPGRGRKKTSDKVSPVSFTEDTAVKLRKCRRTVERMVKLGESLDDEAAKLLEDTSVANKQSELSKLCRLPRDVQRQVAEKLAEGQAPSVAAATGTTASAPNIQNDAKRGLVGLTAVVAALKNCDIYDEHAGAVLSIKHALEHHAKGPDTEVTSKSDEEVSEWRG